ncbi:hypothetical protein LRO89_02945 [Priestia megaterium]|uniref:hypothetical protein n=1 Tax=Priestia megaterium TaxID=1404 RepID=UPI0039C19E12
MIEALAMNDVAGELEIQDQLYSVRGNWHVFKPFLNDGEVIAELNEMMTLLCEMHPKRYPKMWMPGDAPWEYTTTSYWLDLIDEELDENDEYQNAYNQMIQDLFSEIHGRKMQDTELDDDLWDEIFGTDEYWKREELLKQKYSKIYPKEGTIEYYQVYGACHWISRVLAVLIEKALDVEYIEIYQTDTHSVVMFIQNGSCYYADILNEWENLQQLFDFMDGIDEGPTFKPS